MAEIAERLRSGLSRFPRVSLATLPTPLVEAPRLTAALGGPRILIKREDLAGLGLGGSKCRIFEFTIGAAVAQGADVLVAAGTLQANSPQQAAVAGAKLGLPVEVLLGGSATSVPWQGNPLLELLSGAEVRLFPGADSVELRRQEDLLAEELRARGRRPAILSYTRQFQIDSVLAYANYILELVGQLRGMAVSIDCLYVGSGGPTYAGMLLGSLALNRPFRVVGFTPMGPKAEGRDLVAGLLEEAVQLLELDLPNASEAIEILDDFLGEGHGKPTQGSAEAIRLVASTEGIYLDPIYTGKAMAGLIDHARSGQLDGQTVVFAHTGGIPAIFVHAAYLSEAALARR